MVRSSAHLATFFAALLMGLTGGSISVDLSAEVPTVTVCSQAGSYEIALDLGHDPEASIELCCGDGFVTDTDDVLGPAAKLLIAEGDCRALDRPVIQRSHER